MFLAAAFLLFLFHFIKIYANVTIHWQPLTDYSIHEKDFIADDPIIIEHYDSGLRRPPTFEKLATIEPKFYVEEEDSGKPKCLTDTEVLTYLLANDYSKNQIPDKHGVKVTVEFWIQEISSISELTSDFEVGFL
uniref:Uncharacterized protein n=1 Tax=Panagrolaimus davidi TaxID=227884 RepID=A0A914P9D2_9BILA